MNKTYVFRTLTFFLLIFPLKTVSMQYSLRNIRDFCSKQKSKLPAKALVLEEQSQQKPSLLQSYTLEQREALKQSFIENLKKKPWGAVAEREIKKLEAEEQEIFKEFSQITGIDQKVIEDKIRSYYDINANDDNAPTLDLTERKDIDDIILQAGIDPALIDVRHGSYSSHGTAYYAGNHTIFLDTSMKSKNNMEHKALSAHELAHIIRFDVVKREAFLKYAMELDPEATITKKSLLGKIYTVPVPSKLGELEYKYVRLHERGADIYSSFITPDFADAAARYYMRIENHNRSLKSHEKITDLEHPIPLARVSYLHDLCVAMEQTEDSLLQDAPLS